MPIIASFISIISIIIYLFNIVCVFIFAVIIIERLYISKKFSKSQNFDLYNDLFSWIIFFISIGIVNAIEIFFPFIMFNDMLSYFLFKITILIMFSAFFMKIVHVEKIMRRITYERHYYAGIVLFPIILILVILEIPSLPLILIFLVTSMIPFLFFFSFLRNKEISIKNSIKICIGAVFLAFGCILTAEYASDFTILNESLKNLYNLISLIAPIFFLAGLFLIFDAIRRYLRR